MTLTFARRAASGCALGATLCALAACASSATPDTAPVPDMAVTSDGCGGIRAGYFANPDSAQITKVAEPIKMDPPPIRRPVPAGVIGRDGKADVEVTVFVDTLGKADMKTFKIVKTTHPWLATSVKNAIAKWKFRPAEVNGCKVPRTYKFGASAGQ
jgi:hypothetical protein